MSSSGGFGGMATAPATSTSTTAPVASRARTRPTRRTTSPTPTTAGTLDYLIDVETLFQADCYQCHGPGGQAIRGGAQFQLSANMSDELHDFASALQFVDAPLDQSTIVQKATGGLQHGGSQVLAPGSADLATLLAWIAGGAIFDKTQVATIPTALGVTPQTSGPGSSVLIAVACVDSGATIAVSFDGAS